MRRSKTMLVLIVISLFVLSLSIGGAAKKYTIGFANVEFSHVWRAGLNDAVKQAFVEYPNVDLIITDGQGNATKQLADVEDLITRRCDLIILSPVVEDALKPACERVMDAGIPLILFDRDCPGAPKTTLIHCDNYDLGEICGLYAVHFLRKKYGEAKGKVIQLEGSAGSSPAFLRKKGFEDIVQAFPGIKVVASQPTNWSRAEGLAVTENLLQAYPDVDLVYGHCDGLSLGAIEALEQVNKDGDVFVLTASDALQESIQAIVDGKMHLVQLYPWSADVIADTAMKILEGKEVPKEIKLATKVFTPGNAADYLDSEAVFANIP